MSFDHQYFLEAAFKVALNATMQTSPNPRVGSILVKDNQIISSGFHTQYGSPHAEVECLKNISDTTDCTLYVTLEPCCHIKKQTPPCTNLIIEKKIKHVVIGALDGNPLVSGNGVKILQDAGIRVEVINHFGCGLLAESFNYFIHNKNPYISLKWAQTLDGKVATSNGDSKWITNPLSRKNVHQLRRMNDVIITGANTIRVDNPKLTARDDAQFVYCPHRLIVTQTGEFKFNELIFSDNFPHKTTIICTGEKIKNHKINPLIEIIYSKPDELFADIKNWMNSKNYITAMVEAGPKLMTHFIKNNVFNRVHIFIAPKILGSGQDSIGDLNILKIDNSLKLCDSSFEKMNEDLYFTARKEYV